MILKRCLSSVHRTSNLFDRVIQVSRNAIKEANVKERQHNEITFRAIQQKILSDASNPKTLYSEFFFCVPKSICDELEREGFEVTSWDERNEPVVRVSWEKHKLSKRDELIDNEECNCLLCCCGGPSSSALEYTGNSAFVTLPEAVLGCEHPDEQRRD